MTRKLRSPISIAQELLPHWPDDSGSLFSALARMQPNLAAAVAVEIYTTLTYDRSNPKAAAEFRQMLNGYAVGAQL